MNLNFFILLGAFIAGAMFAVMITGLIFTSNYKESLNEKAPGAPPRIGISNLSRHNFEIAISMDRDDEEPEETIKRVKKEFAAQIVGILDNLIEVRTDYITGHYIFTCSIWTKEAADK